MNYPEDHIACEQARVLLGLQHRRPQDNYSFEMFNEVPLVDLARSLAGRASSGEMADFILAQGPGEPDPLRSVRVCVHNVVRRF